jgi:hypothetical protein
MAVGFFGRGYSAASGIDVNAGAGAGAVRRCGAGA